MELFYLLNRWTEFDLGGAGSDVNDEISSAESIMK